MYKKILISFYLAFFFGCTNYVHTRTNGDTAYFNNVLEEVANDKTKRDAYLDYSKKIFPNVSNLPSSMDSENSVWIPPKIIDMKGAFYETDKLGQEGEVLIATLISEEGEVIISKTVESTNDNLNKSATASVTRWKILAATIDGKPCKSVLLLPFNFTNKPSSKTQQEQTKSIELWSDRK